MTPRTLDGLLRCHGLTCHDRRENLYALGMLRLLLLVTSGCVLASACASEGAAPAPRPRIEAEPLRRLSHSEYRATLTDLFPQLVVGVDVMLPDLPPDLRRGGLENDASALGASELLVRRYEQAAREFAHAATLDEARLQQLLPCEAWATPTEQSACMEGFVRSFGLRALREPVSEETSARLLGRMQGWAARVDFRGAIELAITSFLLMPRFLYRLEITGAEAREGIRLSDYELASRLSYALWQSMPDEALFQAAADGELSTEQGFQRQVSRMLAAPQTTRSIAEFHRQWLDADRILQAEHDVRAFDPSWSPETQRDAHEELRRFLMLSAEREDTLTALLTSREAWVSPRLAPYYNMTPAEDAWSRVTLPEERSGVLTRIATLASHAHAGYPSPPLRGNYVLSRLLCRPPGSPPASADLSQPTRPPGEVETNRQSFARRTSGPACVTCHQSMDGIGFTLEGFDERGVTRTQDQGLPVDTTGGLFDTDVDGPVANARALSERLAGSRALERCYADRWVSFVWGRPAEAPEAMLSMLTETLHTSHGSTRALLREIVSTYPFQRRSEVGQ